MAALMLQPALKNLTARMFQGLDRLQNSPCVQCVTIPKILNDTDTDTFLVLKIFDIDTGTCLVPNFTDTGSKTFSATDFSDILVLILFSEPIFSDIGLREAV